MALMGPKALTEAWAKAKAWFGRKVTASRTATTVSVQLKNEANDNLGDAATIQAADATNAGVMTADMYTKLSNVETGANKTTVDSALSSTSTNPVQNKVVNTALSGKAASVHSHDNATTSAAGFMSATDKVKLEGIETEANKYVHPTTTAVAASAKKVGNDANGHVVLGDALTASDVGAAASSHAHGNITNGGDITASSPTIANGDKLIINDESESKLTNGPSFGTSTSTYLRNDGTWGTPSGTYSHPSHTPHTTSSIYKFTNDSNGHVNSATAATASDIVSLLGTTAVNRASANSSGTSFGDAATKGVDSSISSGSTSVNLPTSAAVASFVAAQITGATAFQGTADTNADISGSDYLKGWYWVVSTAGTYVGQTCEIGDMVFAIEDKGASYSALDFSVVQNNIVEMTEAEVDAICV